MSAHAAAHNLTLPVNDKGNISLASKQMKLAGLTDRLPCWPKFEAVCKLKKSLNMIEQYRAHARKDGRIHSIVSFITAAGRTSCSDPNVQATTRNSKLRAVVAATHTKTLVWADYSAVELRIASANAERAIRETQQRLKDTKSNDDLDYYHRMCRPA
jgi:DNA polymerase I-like protein with 3'-5' exonuclease and polymerase domains